ncbi:MAG: hypothetical protein HQL24_08280 [Candidatus Omnitrophica bacterium]|nr:hypothetical protein [Candidatus Omnitrophota bacterium]
MIVVRCIVEVPRVISKGKFRKYKGEKLKRFVLVIFFCIFFVCPAFSAPAHAPDSESAIARSSGSGFRPLGVIIEDPAQFKLNNPDGNKYEFVKAYLNSLSQLKTNAKQKERAIIISQENFSDPETIRTVTHNLAVDNVNLRVARNYLQKFLTPDNGLILKASDLFIKSCNEQIGQNNLENGLLLKLSKLLSRGKMDKGFQLAFFKKVQEISLERKESNKKILQASLLVGKVLISSSPDSKGDFVYLGLTKEEKNKLLSKLDRFYESEYQGELREGQTFLAGSVIAIRQVLEDKDLMTRK